MSDIPTYSDIEEDIRVLQNLEVPIGMARKKATIVIQNVSINKKYDDAIDMDSVVVMIRQYGGVQNFIKAIYSYVIQECNGKLTEAAKLLGIPRQTLSEFRRRCLLSGKE